MSHLQSLVRSRCALTVQAASKSGQNDGALTVVLQMDTAPFATAAAAAAAGGAVTRGANAAPTRLIECELSPAQLFTLLAVVEEAHAKLVSRQQAEDQ